MNKKLVIGFVVVFALVVAGMFYFDVFGLTGRVVGIYEDFLLEDVVVSSNEIISKRTYDSQTFRNDDGSYTAEIYAGNVFFFDGDDYVELNKVSEPMIEKKIITLTEVPDKNVFEFGTFRLHKGIEYSLEQGNLVLRDANDRRLMWLPEPFSIDADGDVLVNDYVLDFDEGTRELGVGVEVDWDWLRGASYPVEVDPSTTLDNSTGIYDGYLIGNHRVDNAAYIYLGIDSEIGIDAERSFIEFNTSSLNDNATITNVSLQLEVNSNFAGSYVVNITRFNDTRINDNITNFPDNTAGNDDLWYNISVGGFDKLGNYITDSASFQSTGIKTFDLGGDADSDLEANLANEFFAIGFVSNAENSDPTDETIIYSSGIWASNSSKAPQLTVTYSIGNCPDFDSGDQTCNETCTYTDRTLSFDGGDLYIQDNCLLTLAGTTTLYFGKEPNAYIYVSSGGEIRVDDTAELSSPS